MRGREFYIGIDPGTTGGIVTLHQDHTVVDVCKTPSTIQDFINRLSPLKDCDCFAMVEKVHATPKQGVKSAFTFGYNVGVLHSVLATNQIPYELHTPQKWMKWYSMKKKSSESQTQWKNRLKHKAQQLFPKEKITLWNADAFLIAWYALNNF